MIWGRGGILGKLPWSESGKREWRSDYTQTCPRLLLLLLLQLWHGLDFLFTGTLWSTLGAHCSGSLCKPETQPWPGGDLYQRVVVSGIVGALGGVFLSERLSMGGGTRLYLLMGWHKARGPGAESPHLLHGRLDVAGDTGECLLHSEEIGDISRRAVWRLAVSKVLLLFMVWHTRTQTYIFKLIKWSALPW